MKKKLLRNKIDAFIRDVWNALPKSYHIKKIDSDRHWLDKSFTCKNYKYTFKFPNLLEKHKMGYVGHGASRVGFVITHGRNKYLVKLCYNAWAWRVSFEKNDNYTEWCNYKVTEKYPHVFALFLPFADHFFHDIAGHVNVFPFVEDVGKYNHKDSKSPYFRVNKARNNAISEMTIDNHDENVGMWKNFVWLVDFNSGYTEQARYQETYLKRALKRFPNGDQLDKEMVDLTARTI